MFSLFSSQIAPSAFFEFDLLFSLKRESYLSYNILIDTCRELFRYLLIIRLDNLVDKQEVNIIFKSINITMLNILENCDITLVISALL